MNILFYAIALSFIPLVTCYVIFLLLQSDFVWYKGLIACLSGLLAVFPVVIIQNFASGFSTGGASTLAQVFAISLLFNGLVEELIKTSLMFLIPAKKTSVKCFLLYGILAGLCLGCFESLIYLINGYSNITLRLITAVVIHTVCSALGSLFVFSVKSEKKFYIVPFIFAVVLHGFYDYFACFSNFIHYFKYAVILIAIVECSVRYYKIVNKDPNTISVL